MAGGRDSVRVRGKMRMCVAGSGGQSPYGVLPVLRMRMFGEMAGGLWLVAGGVGLVAEWRKMETPSGKSFGGFFILRNYSSSTVICDIAESTPPTTMA